MQNKGFAVNGNVGIAYSITENISLDTSVRYSKSSFKEGKLFDTPSTNLSLSGVSLNIGAKYIF